MERYSEEAIVEALTPLSTRARLAFALSCGERLFPNYLAFKRATGWGEPEALRHALDIGWASLEGADVDVRTLAAACDDVQAAEPETENFATILVSSALDAAAAAGLVLRLIEDGNPSRVVEIASLCRDTVDMFIQDREDLASTEPDLEERIQEHHLMQTELRRQRDDLRELSSFVESEVEVARLRAKWRNPGQSNIEQAGSPGGARMPPGTDSS